MPATLLTHRGSHRVTREQLSQLPVPVQTNTWKPLPHCKVIHAITEGIEVRGWEIRKEEFAVASQGQVLFAVFDIGHQDTGECISALSIRTATNKRFAFEVVTGARVVVCDNLLLQGSGISIYRRHTAHFELSVMVSKALDSFTAKTPVFMKQFDEMHDMGLSNAALREMLFDLFALKIMPLKLFHPLVAEYYAVAATRTHWTLLQACTRLLHDLTPQARYLTTMKLGKFFKLS